MSSLGLRRQASPVRESMEQQSKDTSPSRKSQAKLKREEGKAFQPSSRTSSHTKATFLVTISSTEGKHLCTFMAASYFCISKNVPLNLLGFISSPVRASNIWCSCCKHVAETLWLVGFLTIWCNCTLDISPFFWVEKLQNSLSGLLEAHCFLHLLL